MLGMMSVYYPPVIMTVSLVWVWDSAGLRFLKRSFSLSCRLKVDFQ